jgi:hypothetical protein
MLLQVIKAQTKWIVRIIKEEEEEEEEEEDNWYSSQAKTDSHRSKPFQSGLNRLPPFQAISVRPKPTSSIPMHSSQAKTDFLRPIHSSQV